MSTRNPPSGTTTSQQSKSAFQAQREVLVKDIAVAFENVLQNINKLNRSLEGVIAVGNEFGAVEALWSQFEGVMAQAPEEEGAGGKSERGSEDEDGDDRGGEIGDVVEGKGEGR